MRFCVHCHPRLFHRSLVAGTLPWILTAILAGCHAARNDDCDAPGRASVCGLEPVYVSPLGSSVDAHVDRQREHALEAAYVFYRHEWFAGGDRLGPGGRRHLETLLDELFANDRAILLEPEFPDTADTASLEEAYAAAGELDRARQAELIELLRRAGIPNAEQRVVLAHPRAEGLRGIDQRVYQNLMNNRGQGNFGQGSTTGGFGTGSGFGSGRL